MCYGNWEQDRMFARMFDPAHVSEFYKNPEEHLEQVAGIIERNATCEKCGKKTLNVVSVEDKKAVCSNCGHEQS